MGSLPARYPTNDPSRLRAWREGNRHFNQGRYFEAHEAWETGWTRLPEPERTAIQAVIQGAAVFVLLRKGRSRAARSVARAALTRFASLRGPAALAWPQGCPRVVIPGLQKLLRACLEEAAESDRILTKARALRAFLRMAE